MLIERRQNDFLFYQLAHGRNVVDTNYLDLAALASLGHGSNRSQCHIVVGTQYGGQIRMLNQHARGNGHSLSLIPLSALLCDDIQSAIRHGFQEAGRPPL